MSHYSWYTLVKQVQKRRILLVHSSATFLRVRLPNLLYYLRMLGVVKRVIKLTDDNHDCNFLSVVANATKPCVLVKLLREPGDYQFYFNGLVRLAKEKKCILILHTRNVRTVSHELVKHIPCLLRNFSSRMNMFEEAIHCSIVLPFWLQKRGELFVTEGPLFLDRVDNMCVTLNFTSKINDSRFEDVVMQMQRFYHVKVGAVVVIQRAVKQWLYRPQACLSQKIVQRLNCCKK